MSFQKGFHLWEEVGLDKFFVCAGMGPDGVEAKFVAGLEPMRDLFDRGLLEVVGQGGLANPTDWPSSCASV